MKIYMLLLFLLSLISISCNDITNNSSGPKILIVTAHPDDEILFAGTVYKTTTFLNGQCDVFLITNGEGGYKYSTLSERIYNLELTEESIGRKHLPEIRKKELLRSGKIMGIHNYYFLEQKDHRYTLNPKEVLDGIWDIHYIKKKLNKLLLDKQYDYIFTLIPSKETHGHHKMATILALEVVKDLNLTLKPVILAGATHDIGNTPPSFTELTNFPITKIKENTAPFTFNRNQNFSYKNRLNYKIIANWAIAEHKSQGTMQLLTNKGDYEYYFYFDINPENNIKSTQKFFDSLEKPQFPEKTYNP